MKWARCSSWSAVTDSPANWRRSSCAARVPRRRRSARHVRAAHRPDSRPPAQFRYADGRTLPTSVVHVRAWRIRLAAYGARLERVLG